MTDPTTPEEWQDAVDSAHSMILLRDLILYGLATGPEVNVERCDEILRRGKEMGIEPRADAIERTFGAKS